MVCSAACGGVVDSANDWRFKFGVLKSGNVMSNKDKLKQLVVDVFVIEPEAFRLDLRRDEIDTWDSLGVVSLAVGVQETFGYHFTPEEAVSVQSVGDIVKILESKGITF